MITRSAGIESIREEKQACLIFYSISVRSGPNLYFHLNLHCQCNIIITSKVRSTYLMSFDIRVAYPELRSQLNIGKFIPLRPSLRQQIADIKRRQWYSISEIIGDIRVA